MNDERSFKFVCSSSNNSHPYDSSLQIFIISSYHGIQQGWKCYSAWRWRVGLTNLTKNGDLNLKTWRPEGLMPDDWQLMTRQMADNLGLMTNNWQQMMTDNWQLTNDDWQLRTDVWRLMTDDWWLMTDYWQLMTDNWQLMTDNWWLTTDDWLMTDWWLTDDWLMTD